MSNPSKLLQTREAQRTGRALVTESVNTQPYIPSASRCPSRVTEADPWPDEAPTLPSGNSGNFRKQEISRITITDGRDRAVEDSGDTPQSARNAGPAHGEVLWHYVGIGDDTAHDSLTPLRRRNIRRHAQIEIEFDRDTQFYTGLSQDISEGGVFIATYQVQPIGTPVSLSFELPDGTKIVARGEVRWIREPSNACRPGMGVAFTEMTREALTALAKFCRRFAPLYIEI